MKKILKKLSVTLCAAACFGFSIAHAATTNVEISGFAFVPNTVVIAVGDTVTWTERDGFGHSSTSDTGVWNSGSLPFNGSFSFTFNTAGTYPYHCTPHPEMTGTVIVEASGNTPPSVTITNPLNGGTFTAGEAITIAAEATDSDGSVTNVEFFDGATSLGSDTSSPYSINTTLFTGVHLLTAVASDNDGATTTSAIVTNTGVTTAITNPIAERIPKGDITVELRTIADGMISPLGMAVPTDGSGRMFVYDQAGLVWIVRAAGRSPTPLLDVRTRLVALSGNYDERGLLGLALHPGFATNRLLYTYTSEPTNGVPDFLTGHTNNNHHAVIAEWQVSAGNSNAVDLASRREIMRMEHPQSNHNGGAMHFGPDGNLYVSLGDGGNANDVGAGHVPGGNAQDINRILGKVIRIDVNGTNSANGKYGIPASNPFVGTNGLDEIYAFGLRNPYSFTFDSASGQLYLADVGQNRIEEIDIITSGGNYGWNVREGTFWFDSGSGAIVTAPVRPPPPNMIDPIAQYDHDDGTAVVAGYVYHGSAIPGLTNRYVFGDWGIFGSPSGRLYYLDAANSVKELRIGLDDRTLGYYLKGYGQDASGELYVFGSKPQGPTGIGGVMYKLVPAPASLLAFTGSTVTNGTNFLLSWSGGVGPYAVQRKALFEEPVWMNDLFSTGTTATVAARNTSGFFRAQDTAQQPAVPLTALLNGQNETPPIATAGEGFAVFSLSGNSLTFTITYKGLGSSATLAHIHGPAATTNSTGILIDLQPYHHGPFNTNGAFSGTIVLTDRQKTLLMSGLTYVNIHTVNNGGGEIRGQIAPVLMEASILAIYESSAINSTGRGFGSFTLVGNELTFNIAYTGLGSLANNAHIHGRAPIGQDAGVIVNLAPFHAGAFGTRGSFSGKVVLTPAQLGMLIDGQTYVNIHTVNNGGGEIRGQIVPRLTAIPLTAWISGLNERPNPLTNTATGSGIFALEGNTLAFNINYSGLNSPATAAHIHGPSTTATFTNVLIDLAAFHNGPFSTNGAFSGIVNLTPTQRNYILSGLTYFNVHTTNHPPGEARGQIAAVLMSAAASGPAERPTSIITSASALGLFTLVGSELDLNVVYNGLSGPATGAHIHGPATTSQTANILVDLAPFNGGAFSTSGSLTGTTNLNATVLGHVIDSLTYMNFHTPTNGPGEIRGQLLR